MLFFHNYVWRNWLLFGETAISDNGKAGTLNGLILPVDKHVDLALVYRYFDPGSRHFQPVVFRKHLPSKRRRMVQELRSHR